MNTLKNERAMELLNGVVNYAMIGNDLNTAIEQLDVIGFTKEEMIDVFLFDKDAVEKYFNSLDDN